jgi:type VI secretion system protein VasG
MEVQNTDLQKILRHFEINETRLLADLTRAMEGFKTGNARTPALSPRIPRMIEEAWLTASVDFQAPLVRSGHILLALLANDETARMLISSSEAFKKISVETLTEHLADLTAGSKEEADAGKLPKGVEPGAAPAMPAGTKALDQFTINLTERARKGEIDPVIGRDFEIRQMVDILIRRRQNNPILTGEAGVGKTAVVEGFALRIVQGDIPPPLRNVEIRTLDLGLLQAGAGIKGEFENRLKSVINEVKASPIPIVLFIDEAHTLIGAGGSAGSGDAATSSSLLWPAGNCAPSPPPPGLNIRNISKKTPPWRGAFRWSRSRSRTKPTLSA